MSRLTLKAASPLARAVHLALLGFVAGPCVMLPGVAVAQQQVARFDIAPGPLGSALGQFANRAGVTLSFASEQTDGLTSPGLRGEYTVDEGLARLLEGSGEPRKGVQDLSLRYFLAPSSRARSNRW